MVHHQAIRSFGLLCLLSFSCSLLVTACGDGGEGDGATEEGFIDESAALDNIVSCGLYTEGRIPPLPQNEFNQCQTDCFVSSDCDEIKEVICDDAGAFDYRDTAFYDCVSACLSFSCNDGHGIPQEYVCDGYEDCYDGEDEESCDPTLFFNCDDGGRVSKGQRCDSREDCDDGSDEHDCTEAKVFTCQDGSVIPETWRCDGDFDCAEEYDSEGAERDDDYSDEEGCSPRTFGRCSDGTPYSIYDECDGHPDCTDGSDEPADCAVKTCPSEP